MFLTLLSVLFFGGPAAAATGDVAGPLDVQLCGGGAIDPLSGAIALGVGALALRRRLRTS